MNKIWVVFFLTVFSLQAMALNLQSIRFTDGYRYSLVEDSYQEKFKGDYVFSTSLSYTNSPFYVSDKDVKNLDNEIINYQYYLTTGATWYFNHTLAMGIDINAVHSEVLDSTYTTLADTILRAKYNLYRGQAYSLSVNPKLYLPTGQTENYSTINSLGGSLSVVNEYKLGSFHFLGSLGYFHGDNNKVSIVDYRNLVMLNLAASYDINNDWTLNAEMLKNFTTNRDYRQDEGDYYLTAKYKLHPLAGFFFGAGMAGMDEIDRNNYSIFTGIKFHQ